MSVKSKLARQAVKTTAKHTAHGTASKFNRRPLRSITLLALGAMLGGVVGWLVGHSGGDDDRGSVVPTGPTGVVTDAGGSSERAAGPGAVS